MVLDYYTTEVGEGARREFDVTLRLVHLTNHGIGVLPVLVLKDEVEVARRLVTDVQVLGLLNLERTA